MRVLETRPHPSLMVTKLQSLLNIKLLTLYQWEIVFYVLRNKKNDLLTRICKLSTF